MFDLRLFVCPMLRLSWIVPFPVCTTVLCAADFVESVCFPFDVPSDAVAIAAPAGSNESRRKETERMQPERELSQLPLPDTDATMPDPEEGVLVDGHVVNESIVDAVKWCGCLRRSTVPVAAPLELLNFPSTTCPRRSLVCSPRLQLGEQVQDDRHSPTLEWTALVQTVSVSGGARQRSLRRQSLHRQLLF